jgi:hypothetical protein
MEKSARARGLEHTGFLSADLRQIEKDQAERKFLWWQNYSLKAKLGTGNETADGRQKSKSLSRKPDLGLRSRQKKNNHGT